MINTIRIRPLHPASNIEVTQVAARMRQTLIEVLGAERGQSMYPMDWLVQRVLFHLDPDQVTGAVFVAENQSGEIVGHTIVRIDADDAGDEIGLFSTTYVAPSARRLGVATLLLQCGEKWMSQHDMQTAVTYTDVDNIKLQNLYISHGYSLTQMPKQFVKLAKLL